jgi:hypothetical protein
MPQSPYSAPSPERIKFVYNAQFPSPPAIVLDYLLNNPHFTGRQGRQKAMDAIAAFYRPMAEEVVGDLPEEQIKEVARSCIEVLSKQIEELRTRYQLEDAPSDTRQRSSQFEEILVSKLDAIADAIRSQSPGSQVRGTIAHAPQDPSLTHAVYDFEQGIHMERNELGDLELTLDDIRSEYVS